MSLTDVFNSTTIMGYTPTLENDIRAALTTLYNNSATARYVLDKIGPTNPLLIEYVPDAVEAVVAGGIVRLDMSFLAGIRFFDDHGQLREFGLEQALIHEVAHAIAGLDDPKRADLDSVDADFRGDTVGVENNVVAELGYGYARSGYHGWTPSTFSPANATFGHSIDISYVDIHSGVSYGLDRSADTQNINSLLIMTDDDDDLVYAGAGRDYVYSGDGADVLTGGTGSDYLNGGEGADELIASAGLGSDDLECDYLEGGAGSDTYRVDNGSDAERDVQRGGAHGSINYDMFNYIDIIKDSDGTITYQSEYKQGGNSIGDYAIVGTFSQLLYGSYSFGPGMFGNADQVNGLNPVWITQLTIDGSWYWNLYATAVSWVNPVTGIAASGIVFFEEGLGAGTYRAVCAIEGFSNGDLGITLTGYTGSAPPAPTERGSDGADDFDGNDSYEDVIYGYGGDDVVDGLGGDDQLNGDEGDDELNGGDGDDLLDGGAGADAMDGGAGTDTVSYSRAGGDVYVHMGWVQQNLGDAAGDTYNSIENVVGSYFDDTIIATSEANVIRGLNGNDALSGLEGNDTIYGGDGWDQIYGDQGDDLLYGNEGDDIIFGYEDDDTLIMGSGDDFGIGGEGEDIVEGEEGADELHGHEDDDLLDGGAGDDLLFGDEGDDRIILGAGNDFTLGGTGNDTFVFASQPGGDTIGDFTGGAGASDVIELSGLGISTYVQLQTYMSEWNGTTYIEFDQNNYIVLEGVTISSLSQDDFIFV
ncbi:MAG TPA: calcium-binding protein [Xanthobacteraceae bacterium]|nr:calcium-binding protein [Xanthobacteraceae bacterium]